MQPFQPDITIEEIRKLPLKAFRGNIYVISDFASLQKALAMIKQEKVLGFDTETRPSFKKGRRNKVAILQLATDHYAWLFRISRIGLPSELAGILEDPEIMKIGCAMRDDLKALTQIRAFEARSTIDLQKVVKDYGIEAQGLRKLAAIILGFRISKSQQVTNWENAVLTESQILYAATDAWVCFQIWKKLNGAGRLNE